MSSTYQLKRSALFLSLVLLSSQYVLAGDNLTDLNIQTLDATENSKQNHSVEQSPSEQQLPTIVVSADQDQTLSAGQISKTSQVGMLGDKQDLDIPFSITSYTSKYIADQQATSVADALRSEPSVRSVFSKGGLVNISIFVVYTRKVMNWLGMVYLGFTT